MDLMESFARIRDPMVGAYRAQLRKLGRGGEGGRFLDVGTGLGFSLLAASEEGWEAQGVEVSEVCVKMIREKLGLRCHHGTLFDLQEPENSFDVVYMGHVLEHQTEPLRFLKRAGELLRDRGVAVILVPNQNSLFGKLRARLKGREFFHTLTPPWGHLFSFGPTSLGKLLARAGFEIKGIRSFHSGHPVYSLHQGRPGLKGFVARCVDWLASGTGRGSILWAVAEKRAVLS